MRLLRRNHRARDTSKRARRGTEHPVSINTLDTPYNSTSTWVSPLEDSNHDDLSSDDGDDDGWGDDDDGVPFESQDINSEAIGTVPPDTSIGMASGHINNGPDGSNGNDSGSDINASHIQNDHPRQHKRNSIEIHLHPTTTSARRGRTHS